MPTLPYASIIQKSFLSNMTSKKVVTGTKVITRNWNVDFGSVALFEVNDEKIISDEKVVNAITCDFPCKILKKISDGVPLETAGPLGPPYEGLGPLA